MFKRNRSMSNAITWFEIPVTDLDRATQFYAALTGRALTRMDFGVPGQEDAVFDPTDEADLKGALVKSDRVLPSAQGSLVYLNVGSGLDQCLARATRAGGSVAQSKTALPPGMGFFAHIIDTEGNRVGVHALD
jgi:uncharacterized protein